MNTVNIHAINNTIYINENVYSIKFLQQMETFTITEDILQINYNEDPTLSNFILYKNGNINALDVKSTYQILCVKLIQNAQIYIAMNQKLKTKEAWFVETDKKLIPILNNNKYRLADDCIFAYQIYVDSASKYYNIALNTYTEEMRNMCNTMVDGERRRRCALVIDTEKQLDTFTNILKIHNEELFSMSSSQVQVSRTKGNKTVTFDNYKQELTTDQIAYLTQAYTDVSSMSVIKQKALDLKQQISIMTLTQLIDLNIKDDKYWITI